ncbi:phosphoserine phosphatase, chloroplastic isoform X1 [Tanacetum coccineum]
MLHHRNLILRIHVLGLAVGGNRDSKFISFVEASSEDKEGKTPFIKALADYVDDKGLKLGIYSSAGKPVPFKEALAVRLDLFKPSLVRVQDFLEKRPPRLFHGINILVQKLKESSKTAFLISG